MSATTYFGDVVTTGNTNIVQNFTSYGATSRFTSNILGNQSIGTSGAPFGNVFANRSNNTTMNTSTIQVQTISTGNVVASNAYQGGNLFAPLMNVIGVSNTFLLVVRSNVGIGTSGGANLIVQGNVYMANVSTTNVSLYNLLNVSATMNTGTLVTPLSINPVYQLPKDSTLTNVLGGTTNFGSNLSSSGDGSRFVTFPSSGGGAYYSFAYNFTSNVFGGYWDMYNIIQITSPGPGPTNGYASAFSYDGNTVIIGEPSAGGDGLATVYKPSGVGGYWVGNSLNPGSLPVGFGAAVAISPEGDVAVVGAPSTNTNVGIAWAYTYSNGAWSSPISIPYSGFVNQYFGYSVAVCSSTTGGMAGGGAGTNTLLVGAPGAAAVYMYTLGNNTVYLNTTFTFGLSASDWLGYSLSISYDGYLAIAGAPYYSAGVGTVITFGNGGNQTLTSPAGAGGNFGTSVGLAPNGLTAAVGAPNASSGLGYAAKYTLSTPTYTWSSATQLVRPVSTGSFGKSVAVSSCGILVGSGSEKVIFFSFLGYPTAGANLAITGNAWVSNIVTTPNVFATTINAATLNTAILTTTGFDVGTDVSASTFEVLGNIYASNALTTTNIFASIYSTRANVRTMNATTVAATGTISSTINVNTINALSIYSLNSVVGFNTPTQGYTTSNPYSQRGTGDNTYYGMWASISGDGLTALISQGLGAVWVYKNSGGAWSFVTNLTSPGGNFGIGSSLSYDGTVAIVGSYNQTTAGWAGVFRYSGGSWGASTALVSTATGTSWFGFAVSLSSDGNTALVGAPNTGSGYAAVYRYSGSWSSASALTVPAGSGFGYSCALSSDGNTAIVGSGSWPVYNTVGAAYIFRYSGGVWGSSTQLVCTAGGNPNFGASVSLSSDGNIALVGAPYDTNSNPYPGYAFVYTYSGGSWSSGTSLAYPGTANNSRYGLSVSLSSDGNTAVIGAANAVFPIQYAFAVISRYSLGVWSTPTLVVGGADGTSTTFPRRALTVALSGDASTLVVASPWWGGGLARGSMNIYNFINNSVFNTPVVASNIYASNALSGSNLSVTNTIYYNEDLTRRSLYLQPNSLNAPAIQSAISATCNASTKSYWCTSPAPVYGNVLSVSVTSNAYSGGVLVPDGCVVFVTSNCTNIGIFNPVTTAFTSVTGVQPGYNGGVLLPNGNVFFAPQSSNIGLFNPVTSTFSNTGQTLYGQSYNGVLAPEGVWLTPSKYSSSFGASQIALYFPQTNYFAYTIPTEELPRPVSVTAGSFIARGVSIAWSSVIGKFVSIENSGVSWYSSDGQTWTLSTGTTLTSVDPACAWLAVAASPTKFVATGFNGTYNSAYSTDGINWNAPSSFQNLRIINSTMAWPALAYNSIIGQFEAMGTGSIFAGTNYALTPDGITWYALSSTGTGLPYTSLTCDYNGNPLAVSSSSGGAWYYSGGWAQFPPPGGGLTTLQDLGSVWNSVAYSSTLNIFVAVGSTNGGSSSGSAWVPAPPGAPSWSAASPSLTSVGGSSEWTSVSWSAGASMFIAVGYVSGSTAGIGAYSRDGKSWYTLNPPISSLFGAKYITWSSSLGLWAIISGSGGIAPGSGYAYLAADGYNTGSVLLPSGAIIFSPIGSANVMSFQQTYTYLVSNIVVGTDVFNGMVLAPNGNVITVPSGSNIYVINPTTGTSTNVGPIAGSVTNFFRGGALLPSGNVVFAPGTSANVGMFDPVALTYSNSVAAGTSGIAFSGATLLPNGQVVFTPYDSANVGVIDTFAPVSQEFCLSPYFNKF